MLAQSVCAKPTQKCISDLKAFDGQLQKDGNWLWLRIGYPMYGYGYGYAMQSASPGVGYSRVRPDYDVRTLLASANMLEQRGDEQACERSLSSARDTYSTYAADLRSGNVPLGAASRLALRWPSQDRTSRFARTNWSARASSIRRVTIWAAWTTSFSGSSLNGSAKQARFGGIDVLVNNAGTGYFAAIEEGKEAAEERNMFDVNVFGLIRMIQAVLPDRRKRRGGCIVNVSFLGCIRGAGAGPVLRHQVRCLKALRQEVASWGFK